MSKEDEFDFDDIDWENDRLENYLGNCSKKDSQGMYLIHHAIRNNAPLDFILRIVAVLPDCLVLKDKSSKLPLHHAAQVCATDDVMEYLVAQYNKGLRERDHVGMLPVHYLVGSSTSLKLLQLFERHYPESVREKDREGWLPLHHAARRTSSVDVINFLVQKYAGGLSETTYHGSLPLHCAAYYNPNLPVIQLLTEQSPRGLKEGGTNGMKPIHSAARNNRLDILQYFVNQFPVGLHCLDNQERLPIHYAIKNPDPLPIVTYLVNLFPEFVRKVDSNGWLPLHCAARSTDSLELIQYLVKLYPEALRTPDNQQWLPIFHAAKFNRSFEIIRYIYEQYPEGILVKLNEDIYCHEFAPVASNQRNFLGLQFMALDTGDTTVYNEVVRIHLCGDRQSGKTTISNQMKEILLESFNIGGIFDRPLESSNLLKSANLATSTNTIINNTTNSTANIQTPNSYATPSVKVKSPNDTNRIIVKNGSDKFSHYLLYDYGGQQPYHVNHGNFLAMPNSVYVITIPTYDKVNKQKFNLDYLLDRLFYWLKFLYSTAHSMTNFTSSASSTGKVKPVIPIVITLNTFANESKASVEEVNGIKHVLFREALTMFNVRSQTEYLQYHQLDPLYANDHTDFILLGNEILALDLSVKQSVRKVTEAIKRGSPLLHLSPRPFIFSPFNVSYLPDSSAPFFGNRTHQAKDVNPFFNIVKESKLISYCWDVLALLDLSLVMLEEDFRLMLTSTIRTFFHKMLNYKDYKIKENLQTLIEKELYHYLLNYFVFMGKIMIMKRKKTVLPPLKLNPIPPAPTSLRTAPNLPTVQSPTTEDLNISSDSQPNERTTDVKEEDAHENEEEFEVNADAVKHDHEEEPEKEEEEEEDEEKEQDQEDQEGIHKDPEVGESKNFSDENEKDGEGEIKEEEEHFPSHPPPPAPVLNPTFDPYSDDRSTDKKSEIDDDDDDDSSSGEDISDIDQGEGIHTASPDDHSHSHPHSVEYEYIVITSPHLLINTVLDFLIDKLIVEIRQNKHQLLLSPSELESWFRDNSTANTTSSVSPLELLVALKVALPVYYNESSNTQMIRLIHQDDVVVVDSLALTAGMAANSSTGIPSGHNQYAALKNLHQYYWLFQLSNDKIPPSLNINYEFVATISNFNHLHQTELVPTIYREIARIFTFRSAKFFLFPAWFSHLYHFLLYKIPNILHFNIYSDGLLIVSKEIGLVIHPCSYHPVPRTNSDREESTTPSSWSAAHHETANNGFLVKIVTSLMMNIENKNHYINDFIWNLLNEIRYFTSAKFWNYDMQEYAIFPSERSISTFLSPTYPTTSANETNEELNSFPLYPIEEIEKTWFTEERLKEEVYQTYFGIHYPPYHKLYENYASEFFAHKLIYLMKSSSSTTRFYHMMAMVTNQLSRDKFTEKVEFLISRILLASKHALLFDQGTLQKAKEEGINTDNLSLSRENMNEATRDSIIQLIIDYKRPQQIDNTHAVISHYTHGTSFAPHFHHLQSNQSSVYTILTKVEIFQIINKALVLFQDLRENTANKFNKKIQDFPAIPIISYCPTSENEVSTDEGRINGQSTLGDEIVLPEERVSGTNSSTKSSKNGRDFSDKTDSLKPSSLSNIHSFRVHFLCPVCGRRVNSGKDFEGYLITVLNQWSENLLEILVMTMKIFIYVTNIKSLGSNETIPEIAYLLQDTIEVLLSQIDDQFNPQLLSNVDGAASSVLPPTSISKISVPPVILYQLQKKIFYIMKNYSLKSFTQIRKLKDSINQVAKISLPKFSLPDPYSSSSLLPPINTSNLPIPANHPSSVTNGSNGSDRWFYGLFGNGNGNSSTSNNGSGSSHAVSTATTANIANNTKIHGPGMGSNLSHILSEEDIHTITSSTSFSSVVQEIFKFTASKNSSNCILTEDLEKLLGRIPINSDAYLKLLQQFFKIVDDEYLLHTGLMKVENNRGETAWVCSPVLTATGILPTTDSATTTPTLSDFNWNYAYKKDNPRFKSSCADEFLARGKRCLIYDLQEY